MTKDGAHVPPGARRRTLLYVEDNAANLKLVELFIARRSDLRLLSALDGKSGLELARISRPDVIVMDINLPDISGFKALEMLRSDPAMAHVPVVALSANVAPLNVESGLEAGFFRYLTKPIQFNEFMETLDLALAYADKSAARRRQKNERETAQPGAAGTPAK
jgi:CheY-like chemotaxis protein